MSEEEKSLITTNNQLTGMEKKVQALFKKKTPKEVIKLRKGAGGKMFPYVPIDYTLKELDATFGIFWEFLTDEVRKTEKQIIVRGRLVVKSPNGFSVSRPGTGRANIKMYSGTKDSVDEGNDEKAATSDAIKKAASLFGIAADVYYKELDKYEELDEVINQDEELKGKAMSRFFAVAAERGIPSDRAKTRIKEIYKVEHMEQLTAAQMDATTNKIERTYEPVEPGEKPRKVGSAKVVEQPVYPEEDVNLDDIPEDLGGTKIMEMGSTPLPEESEPIRVCPNPDNIPDCQGVLPEDYEHDTCPKCRMDKFIKEGKIKKGVTAIQ